jgi:ABC-2 type transport system permease protein
MAYRLFADWSDFRGARHVLVAVAKRQLLVELRQRNKFVLDLTGHLLGLAPVFLTAWAATGGGATSQGSMAGAFDWLTFVVLGYIAFAAFGVASPVLSFTGMAFALNDEQISGTLERSMLAPAPRIVVALGSGAYYTILYVFHVASLLLFSAIFLPLGVTWSPANLLLALGVLILIVVMSIGFGIISSAVLLTLKDTSLMMILVHRPMLLLSGAYFLIPAIPEPFSSIAWLNPIAYAIDAFRGSMSGVTVLLPLPVEICILLVSTLGTVFAGLALFDRLMNRLLRTGSLGLY